MNQNMNTTKNVVREVSLMKFDNQMQEDIQMSEAFYYQCISGIVRWISGCVYIFYEK